MRARLKALNFCIRHLIFVLRTVGGVKEVFGTSVLHGVAICGANQSNDFRATSDKCVTKQYPPPPIS